MTDGTDTQPSVPIAPPTRPRPIAKRPGRWHSVVGTIAIVFGVLGILMNAWSALGLFFVGLVGAVLAPSSSGTNATGPAQSAMQVMADYRWWLLGVYVAGAGCAVLLLVAGIGVVRRVRWSVPVMRIWGILRMLVVPVAGFVQFSMQRAQFQAFQSDPTLASNPAFRGGMGKTMDVMAVIGGLFTVAWGWALPIFMLVWFARGRIRAEVAAWK